MIKLFPEKIYRWTALTNEALRTQWRFASCRLELQIRRLRMYQRWSEDPALHSQVLAAILGGFHRDGPQQSQLDFNQTIPLNNDTLKFTRQMQSDFVELSKQDDLEG